MNGIIKYAAACALLVLLAGGCGGGGGDSDQGPTTGTIQVLNNTGVDLADVAIHTPAGVEVDSIGGGLAQGATYSFANLAPGRYDVLGFPPGSGFQQILRYSDTPVSAGQVTDLTMTP